MASDTGETCAICGCPLHRYPNTYALPNAKGRSHASSHHCVPKRFLTGKNSKGQERGPVLTEPQWIGKGSQTITLCYDCHEELLHNPILLKEDVENLHRIMEIEEFTETGKTDGDYGLIARRVNIFHEIIRAGIDHILNGQK